LKHEIETKTFFGKRDDNWTPNLIDTHKKYLQWASTYPHCWMNSALYSNDFAHSKVNVQNTPTHVNSRNVS